VAASCFLIREMIWDDPWIAIATDQSGPARRFCTMLPPPNTPLPGGYTFCCVRSTEAGGDDFWKEWLDFVQSRWTVQELLGRLVDAWIPCLRGGDGRIVGTCVLRPQPASVWLLETLRALRGSGSVLMRAVLPWIWNHLNGPFMLGYTWELTATQLMAAWWKGWLCSAVSIQYGWSWHSADSCSFCPNTGWVPISTERQALPVLVSDGTGARAWSAIVSDSGLADGWGYVSVWRGEPDWTAVAKQGGWSHLWCRSVSGPKEWRWTGEFVVVGLINCWGTPPSLEWVSAEIASSPV
jgi:hypothetical protein